MAATDTPASTDPATPDYCGRFAPSPTGPLHFGSLVAAVASYLQARHHGGRWLLRVEDIDPPREVRGAADAILAALERHGLTWDGPLLYQSSRSEAYLDALAQLAQAGDSYPCGCSRSAIARIARPGLAGPVYPGTCRAATPAPDRAHAIRLRTAGAVVAIEDGHYGRLVIDLEREIGDFVLRRADGLFAYQLAVVVDDAAQGVTEVVRGADLLELTPAQVLLQRRLGVPTPTYLHHPLAAASGGAKLSKQTGARPLADGDPRPDLLDALTFLGQAPPDGLRASRLEDLWQWAMANWQPGRMPRSRTAAAPARYEM